MKNNKFLDPNLVKQVMEQARDGQMFTVVFEKQNGELRVLNGRRGVKKHLRGGKSTIGKRKNLVSVYDMQKHDYRCFDTGRTIQISMRGAVIGRR